jgi:hypothetical protein
MRGIQAADGPATDDANTLGHETICLGTQV